MWLLNENAAAWQGHAAIMLVDDEGQGEFYSYAARNDNFIDTLRALVSSPGYLSTVVDDEGKNKKIDVIDDFINNYDDKKGWYVEGVDSINNKGKNIDERGKLTTDYYTYAVYIPITDEEGIAMHERAENIRISPGTYSLLGHNCNQVAQNILSAGGKDFNSQQFSMFATAPNIVKEELIHAINSNPNIISAPSNASFNAEYVDLWRTWEHGRVGDLKYLFNQTEELKSLYMCDCNNQ